MTPADAVTAATASAIDHLFNDLQAEPITDNLTVGIFIQRTASTFRLRHFLQQAEPVGGPRWLDEETCQVRMIASGGAIASELSRIAGDNPKTTPISSRELLRHLASWDAREFTAVGSSAMMQTYPSPPPSAMGWAGANVTDVKLTMAAARRDAAVHAIAILSPIALTPRQTIGDALVDSAARASVQEWLASRPVVAISFGNADVQLTLAAAPVELCSEIRAAILPHPAVDMSEINWAALSTQLAERLPVYTGRAHWGGRSTPRASHEIILSLQQPPDWIDRQLDQGAIGNGANSLLAARAAQGAAIAQLRNQIDQLRLPGGPAIGDAARNDPRFARRVQVATVRTARLYSLDYRPDGSVSARMSLDLREFWEALAGG